MTDSSDLIVPIDLTPAKAVAMFTEDKEFDELFAKIKAQTDSFEPDLSTVKGRDAIKSLAYKVTRTKTALDEMGKGVTHPIDYSIGHVMRTPDHDERVKNPYRPMSLVVDCIK